jgi:hypothetical protein
MVLPFTGDRSAGHLPRKAFRRAVWCHLRNLRTARSDAGSLSLTFSLTNDHCLATAIPQAGGIETTPDQGNSYHPDPVRRLVAHALPPNFEDPIVSSESPNPMNCCAALDYMIFWPALRAFCY